PLDTDIGAVYRFALTCNDGGMSHAPSENRFTRHVRCRARTGGTGCRGTGGRGRARHGSHRPTGAARRGGRAGSRGGRGGHRTRRPRRDGRTYQALSASDLQPTGFYLAPETELEVTVLNATGEEHLLVV